MTQYAAYNYHNIQDFFIPMTLSIVCRPADYALKMNDQPPLTAEDVARINRANEQRDRNDTDFEGPSPRRKRAADDAANTPSAKRKGKKSMPQTADAVLSPLEEQSFSSNTIQRTKQLAKQLGNITQHWGKNEPEWPTFRFAPRTKDKKIEAKFWTPNMLDQVERLARLTHSPVSDAGLVLEFSRLHEAEAVLEHIIAERLGGVGSNNTMTTEDIANAASAFESGLWSNVIARSPTLAAIDAIAGPSNHRPPTVQDDAPLDSGDAATDNAAADSGDNEHNPEGHTAAQQTEPMKPGLWHILPSRKLVHQDDWPADSQDEEIDGVILELLQYKKHKYELRQERDRVDKLLRLYRARVVEEDYRL